MIGRRGARVEPQPIELPVEAGSSVRLEEFLAAVVRVEVDAYRARREDATMVRFLTESEISADAASGAVRFGDAEAGADVDVDAAIEAARLGFVDGLFKVMVEGREIVSLDDTISMSDGLDVLFVRLVALAGG